MSSTARQQGSTLIVSLIMLVVLTILVQSAIRSSNVNLRIAGNVQKQAEATAAAQQAVEKVLSSDFTADLPALATPVEVDIDRNGAADYQVTTVPDCLSAAPVKMSDLDLANPGDKFCFQSASSAHSGVMGGTAAPTGNSVCNITHWDVAATAHDPASAAKAEIHQGVSLRVGINVDCPSASAPAP